MTLTQLAQTLTSDGDKVTLYQTDEKKSLYSDAEPFGFDGFRRRYVFSVAGKSASGFGAVGGDVTWMDARGRREVDPWESGAVPVLALWADADPFGSENDYRPVTIRGAVYRYGVHWKPAHPNSGETWRIDYSGLERVNGTMTDAGRQRVTRILGTARDLFLALPNAETELTRRSLIGARGRQHAIMEAALAAMVKLTDRINAL